MAKSANDSSGLPSEIKATERVVQFRATSADVGKRVDSVIQKKMRHLSRAKIQHLIKNGNITINGVGIKAAYHIRSDDLIRVDIPEPVPSRLVPENIPLRILFEDSFIIVLVKPRGMVVHPGAGRKTGTLVHALLNHCTDLSGIGGEERPGIVHRLDKDTSGLMVVAKNDFAHVHLSRQFAARSVRKIYFAIVKGVPAWVEKYVEAPIKRHPSERKKMHVQAGGRHAVTQFYRLRSGRGIALIKAILKTGRTHQIRVHLQHLGFPVLGDRIYSRNIGKITGSPDIGKAVSVFNGICLHAGLLRFEHPRTTKQMCFTCPIPADMQRILKLAGIAANIERMDCGGEI